VRHVLSLAFLTLIGTLIGCGGSVESPATPDTGIEPADTNTREIFSDAPPPLDSGVAKEVPKEIDSRQKVTFAITNNATSDRWVVMRGMFCTTFSIGGLQLQTGFVCGCECPNPGSARVDAYKRIAPGATYELTWDARALVTYEEALDCSMWGPGAAQKVTRGVLQPVKAGSYTATIALEETVPTKCSVSGDEATCPWSYGGFTGSVPGQIAARCESTKSADKTFTLPASGDIVVPISLE